MSLCIIKYLNKDKLLIGADSRVSTYKNKIPYATGQHMNKLHIVGDKIIFFSGAIEIMNDTFEEYKNSSDKSINSLFQIAKQCTDKYIQENPDYAVIRNNNQMICAMTILVPSELSYYVICNAVDFKPIKFNSKNGNFAMIGWYNDETKKTFEANKNKNIIEAYIKTFEATADECVGGKLTIYEVTRNGIEKEYCFDIKDNSTIRMIDSYSNLKGAYVADSQGNDRIIVDGKDGSLKMYNGYINMTNGDNEININPDNGLTFTSNGSEVVKLDIQNGNATFSGTVSGGKIISDTTIDVITDATIGKTLKIVNGDNGNFFFTISAGGISGDRVCLQAANERTIEIDGGAIYLGGAVFANGDKIATHQQITELEDRIKALEARLEI